MRAQEEISASKDSGQSDLFWHSCPCVERLDAHAMTPKLGTILLLVPPGNHGNWLKEWEKSADADELTELKVELVHIHNTADKKDAPFSYDSDKHWQDLVTDEYNEPWDGQETKIVLTSSHSYQSRLETLLVDMEEPETGSKMILMSTKYDG